MSNLVYIKQNRALTNSKILAETFDKTHAHVLRDIRKQITRMPTKFVESNLGFVNIVEKNAVGGDVDSSYFEMTQDGFGLVAMAYTTQKAMVFKIKFLEEFNRRGDELTKRGLTVKTVAELLEENSRIISSLHTENIGLKEDKAALELVVGLKDEVINIHEERWSNVKDHGKYMGSSEYIQRNWPMGNDRYHRTKQRNALTRAAKELCRLKGIEVKFGTTYNDAPYSMFPESVLAEALLEIKGKCLKADGGAA